MTIQLASLFPYSFSCYSEGMHKSRGLLYQSTSNVVWHNICPRPVISFRRYVNWTPDKNSNKKATRNNSAGPPQRTPGPPPRTDKPQSTADSKKPFEKPRPPPPPEQPASPSSQQTSEPQLLRLKNQKTFNQWENQWRDRVWRAGQVTLVVGVFMVAYAVGAGYIELPYGMNYRPSKVPEQGSEEESEYRRQIEATLHSLPIVNQLSQERDWIKKVGIFPIPAEDVPHSLTVGTLAGIGKISVKPVTFYNDKTKEFVVVMHVGQDVCGHRGLVHGGFLATVLDECLGKTVPHRREIANARQ